MVNIVTGNPCRGRRSGQLLAGQPCVTIHCLLLAPVKSRSPSADHLVLELQQDEDGFCDVADRAGAEHDVLQGAPALRHQREAAFALVAQGAQ
jgi:hypothetical protein